VKVLVHLMQNWFGYSDSTMEEALYETTILRQFSGLGLERIPDETTTLNFRRLLEKHEWAAGILGVINGYLGDRSLSFPGDQAPVWLYQGAVPRLGQEHRADGDAVRVVEPVDGSAFAIEDRRGASVVREMVATRYSQRRKNMK
jgi:hypothetical protein